MFQVFLTEHKDTKKQRIIVKVIVIVKNFVPLYLCVPLNYLFTFFPQKYKKHLETSNIYRYFALVEEEKRLATRQRLENGKSYKWLQKIADIMDRYYLDAALGFAIPGGIGDAIAAVFSIGYILFSAIGVRSFPLTLSIMNNTLRDVVLGMIPFYVGDIFDIFYRSNKQNMALIRGFVEGDEEVIRTVNRKAGYSVAIFIILCILLFLMIRVVIWAAKYMFSLF